MEEKDFIKMMVNDMMSGDRLSLEKKHDALDALQEDIDNLSPEDADEQKEMQEFLNEQRAKLNK